MSECMDVDEAPGKSISSDGAIINHSTIGILPIKKHLLNTPPQKRRHSMIRRPQSSLIKRKLNHTNHNIKRLSLVSLKPLNQQSPNNSKSSNNSNHSPNNKRIKRPRLSISRPTKTINITKNRNNTKRLSLSSISKYNAIKNTNDELFDGASTKSIEISFVSSPSSNSSFIYNITNNFNDIQNDIDKNKMKQIKFEKAKIHLEIGKLRLEKTYYSQIVQSIKNIVVNQNTNDINNELLQRLKHIVDFEH
eukprot:468980_1